MTHRPVTLFLTIYRENPKVLEEALEKYRRSLDKWATKSAIVCVIDAADLFPDEAEALGQICERYGAHVFCTNARAKRENLRNAILWAKKHGVLYEFTLFGDSDTISTTLNDDVVGELLRPFADETIGGVTTAQRLTLVDSKLQMMLDWLEDARIGAGMAAGSAFRQVVCLPGRLYAVRTCAVVDFMDTLVEEKWWVPSYSWHWPFVHFEQVAAHAGDDRRITMRVQEMGYGTVMNPRATVVTTMPRTYWKVTLVLLRWATSSQWLTVVGALNNRWYRRLPMAMYLAWGDIIVTFMANYLQLRFLWSLGLWLLGIGDPDPMLTFTTWLMVTVGGLLFGFGIRQSWHLSRHPRRLFLLPVFVLFLGYLQFIRLIPWFNPRRVNVWGSREGSGLRVESLFFTPYDEWLTTRCESSTIR